MYLRQPQAGSRSWNRGKRHLTGSWPVPVPCMTIPEILLCAKVGGHGEGREVALSYTQPRSPGTGTLSRLILVPPIKAAVVWVSSQTVTSRILSSVCSGTPCERGLQLCHLHWVHLAGPINFLVFLRSERY